MGRPRKNPGQGLPLRLYIRSGTAWYVHRDGHWQKLGRDLEKAARIAREFNAGRPTVGSMGYWLDQWHIELNAQVAACVLSSRTKDDYINDTKPLRKYFGSMTPETILPKHVAAYLTLGRELGRPIRANREKAALSSCFTWMIKHGHADLTVNPCRLVKRNQEKPRARYLEDREVTAFLEVAGPSERALAEMIYRTLQRPADILRWTKSNLVDEGGQRFLQFKQSKTGAAMKIIVTPTVQAALDAMSQARKKKSLYLIAREDGRPYTESGLASMFRRSTFKAKISDFAPYDLKAKGATDMYQAGTAIEIISQLCGHDSTRTTEVYIRQHLRQPILPNDRVLSK